MSNTTSYNSDKVVMGEVEYPATDPASGAFFQPDFKKNDDLKMMLDSSKDSLKLEAMKRIIGMIAKGRDASDLFPAVVKNVVSKNIEVKKLVYVYLVRYAEEQQDLALLSISTFQRALKDPNQLIRASALRVLSSIRVPMIVPIVMLAIRDSACDMSPYVRKTAAHAIPKLYSLDPEQKEELVCIIEKLLSDKAPLVVGSAAMAFSELCAERLSLLHKCYRKLCSLVADVDEWGQCALLDALTVYARTYLPDPNIESVSSESEGSRAFYSSDESGGGGGGGKRRADPAVDPDLRLLLRAAKPLLQSRSAAVVMAVAKLFFHCAPASELSPVVKALVRLLRAPPEVQSVVLKTIAALTLRKRGLFEPYLKSFFVRTSDPTHIKLLKLEVLSRLASAANINAVLAELRTYRASGDKELAAAAVRAVATAALAVPSETQTCLNQLLHLLSSKQEWLVCEAVVGVKRVVGAGSADAAVRRACKLLREDRVCGGARAAALRLVAEHGAHHPRAAAVLAHAATTFPDQEELVKLQLLTLAAKLSVTQPDTLPLGKYLCQLSRYDVSYDVRDRARLVSRLLGRHLLLHTHTDRDTQRNTHTERSQYTVGTLSEYIDSAAAGYRPLPAAPAAAAAADLRGEGEAAPTPAKPDTKSAEFYSEPGSSGSSSESGSSASSSEDESSEQEESVNEKKPAANKKETNNYESTEDSSSDSESSSSESASWSGDSEDVKDNKEMANGDGSKVGSARGPGKSNLELLLELDVVAAALPTITPTAGGLLSPPTQNESSVIPCPPQSVPQTEHELVSHMCGCGARVTCRWSRQPHLHSSRAAALRVNIHNHSAEAMTQVEAKCTTLGGARAFYPWSAVNIEVGAAAHVTLGLDFADSIQPVHFTIAWTQGSVNVSVTPPVGELCRAVTMAETTFDLHQAKLRGMNECEKKVSKVWSDIEICQKVFEIANVGPVTSTGTFLRFAGQMLSSEDLVLVSVKVEEEHTVVRANCQNMTISSLMAPQIAQALAK